MTTAAPAEVAAPDSTRVMDEVNEALRQQELQRLFDAFRDREAVWAQSSARLTPEAEASEVGRWAADWAARVACAALELLLVRVQWIKVAYSSEVLEVPADEREAVFVSNNGPFLGMASRLHPETVYVRADMPVAQIVSTTLHELRHQWQFAGGLWKSDAMEYDATAYAERWRRCSH